MRHVFKGALGAALVYPAVWYGSAPAGAEFAKGAPQRAAVVAARPSARSATRSEQLRAPEPELEATTPSRAALASPRLDAERPTLEELPAALGAPVEPAGTTMPAGSEPGPPSQAFADVREALGQMSELQAHAHDPNELVRRVQAMDQDPEQLARLKALAEMFVQLPPSRLEPYMPARETGAASRGSR